MYGIINGFRGVGRQFGRRWVRREME